MSDMLDRALRTRCYTPSGRAAHNERLTALMANIARESAIHRRLSHRARSAQFRSRRRRGALQMIRFRFPALRQIRVEEAEHVRVADNPHARPLL
jgi:hypothetical protein